MNEDVFEHPDVKAMLRHFRDKVLPNIKGSAITAAIVSKHDPDPKMCLEMGASLLLDKPIIVICIDKAQVSQHLRKIATAIVEVSDLKTEADSKKIQDAINHVLEGMA